MPRQWRKWEGCSERRQFLNILFKRRCGLLHNYVKNILNNTSANNTVSSKPNIDFSIWGSIKEEKLTKFKKTALDNLHSSWINIPHVTQHDEADISDLLELRLKLNKKHGFPTSFGSWGMQKIRSRGQI